MKKKINWVIIDYDYNAIYIGRKNWKSGFYRINDDRYNKIEELLKDKCFCFNHDYRFIIYFLDLPVDFLKK
jgi:hypothetical protein